MSAAPASLLRAAGVGAVRGAAAALLVLFACGKKAPLRLPEQRAAEHAATPRALVRDGRLTLEFTVPPHRVFPEREDPWVLARILRRQPPATDFVEVGAILDKAGLAFGSTLAWSEDAQPGGSSAYRVEFRDGARRRRALSEPVEVAWREAPGPSKGLRSVGGDRAVTLTWDAPVGAPAGTRYQVFRREPPGGAEELLTPSALEAAAYTDTGVQAGRQYCYRVRAVLGLPAAEVAGGASEESCARTEDATPPPPPAALRLTALAGAFQLVWDRVSAPDLLGYRVYRAVDDGPIELLTPSPIPGTAFREPTAGARPGSRFRYVVTAVDASDRRNESPFSPAVEAAVPPPAGAP